MSAICSHTDSIKLTELSAETDRPRHEGLGSSSTD
jgi:hypothetical protein